MGKGIVTTNYELKARGGFLVARSFGSRLISKLVFAFLLVHFFYSFDVQAQDAVKKPKIGLVLSGGGAKGLAHIGVLKVLEQAGIKIDYIGGTSMGAIVGGLYASGYSANQIDSIFKTVDFDKILQDFTPRTSKNFFKKRNDERYALVLPFNKFRIGVPDAFSKSIFNYNLLASLTRNVRHIRDFNQLKIPFFCVATDIQNGEEVILNKGSLVDAMIASSAFPSLFSPVEIDGRLLLDGGIVNNYPVEKVREMGADIIIGVDVQDGLYEKKELSNGTRILGQITTIQSLEKMSNKIAVTDIYIQPDIKSYGIISFDKGVEIIEKGKEAALAVYDQLVKYGDITNYKPNNLIPTVDSIRVNKIVINRLVNFTPSYIKGKLSFKERKTISYDDLRKGIDNLNATDNFSSIKYCLEENNSKDNLLLNVTEKTDKTFLKFGLHYDDLYKSGVLVNLTQKRTFFTNDITSFDVVLGDNIRYNLDYYIDNGFYWSYGFRSLFNGFNKNISNLADNGGLYDSDSDKINVDFSELTNQAYFQSLLSQKFLIGGGIEFKYLKIYSETLSSSNAVIDNSTYSGAFAYFKYDSFDNKYFPRKGWYLLGDIQTYLFSSNYTNFFTPFSIAKVDWGVATSLSKKIALKFQIDGGFSFGGESVPFFDFVLGGYGFNSTNNFKQFLGYDFMSLSGNSYLKSTVVLDYEFLSNNHFNFSANLANLGNNLFQSLDWLSWPQYSGYALGYGLETILGPVEVKYSWSPETSQGLAMFSVGFWF